MTPPAQRPGRPGVKMPTSGPFVMAAALVIPGLALSARPAAAQSITNLSVTKNPGNSADALQTGLDQFQRKTTVAVESSAATSFTTRYAEIVGADGELLSSRTVTQNSDYTIQFDVTAPVGYRLTVNTNLSGAFTLVDDGNTAAADLSAVMGSQTGGTLSSGSEPRRSREPERR